MSAGILGRAVAAVRETTSVALRTVVYTLATRGFVWPWPQLAARNIVALDGSRLPDDDRPLIIALTPERFRGDLAVLEQTRTVRVARLRHPWQGRVFRLFCEVTEPPDGKIRRRSLPTVAMANFLRSFHRHARVDAFLSACIWYTSDIAWGSQSADCGVPYIVAHRENLKTEPRQRDMVIEAAEKVGRFSGFGIVVHNDAMRQTFIDCGFAAPEQVIIGGALRMDQWVRRVRAAAPLPANPARRRKVTFFSFTTGQGLLDLGISPFEQRLFLGWFRLFELSHVAFAALAARRPDIDFIIKPKWDIHWVPLIEKALQQNGLEAAKIPNLKISSKFDAHQLILESDVVCAFGSTTLLEAGIAGKPVIVPHFEEPLRSPYKERVALRAHYDLFDVAESAEAFADRIAYRLEHPEVAAATVDGCWDAFGEWVSDVTGKATERYVALLQTASEARRAHRDVGVGSGARPVTGVQLSR